MKQMLLPKNCYGYYRPAITPLGIVAHYMSAQYANNIGLDNSDPYDVNVCYEILKHYGYSAHVLIGRDGEQYQLVPFMCQAYHAGLSIMNGREDCNKFTLSFECISIGKPNINGDPAFEESQIESIIDLIQSWVNTYSIEKDWIKGHSDVRDAALAAGLTYSDGSTPSKKYDPGQHFPWQRILNTVRF